MWKSDLDAHFDQRELQGNLQSFNFFNIIFGISSLYTKPTEGADMYQCNKFYLNPNSYLHTLLHELHTPGVQESGVTGPILIYDS